MFQAPIFMDDHRQESLPSGVGVVEPTNPGSLCCFRVYRVWDLRFRASGLGIKVFGLK